MSSFFVYSLSLLILAAFAAAVNPHKVCVPENALEACKKMVKDAKKINIEIVCVEARDRLDCLGKVRDNAADFEAVEPEDMYLAAKMKDDIFKVFKEIRTKEEPEAEFRYEAVAVVHKDLHINSLHDLKGLRSCHTGVGRNVGYKVPITKLSNLGFLQGLNDTNLTPRETELRALSQFFSKGCLVGKWSPHPETDRKLKGLYSNLCDLCEHPSVCDYPDANSGYEGALRCLAKGGGQIAWTKVIFVKKVFGMPYGLHNAQHTEYDPKEYSYLCSDATKKPVTGQPCTWAARPWPGYITSTAMTNEISKLREEVSKLNDLGESEHADWLALVLSLNNKTIAKDNGEPIQPLKYLQKARYLDVIERSKVRKMVLCVEKIKKAEEKCDDFRKAAFSRDIRPQIECMSKETPKDCMEAIKGGQAQIGLFDPHQAIRAEGSYGLKPLAVEKYESEDGQQLMALVKKSSSYKTLADLKGSKACIQTFGMAGFIGTVKVLLDAGLIPKNECPHDKSLSAFFSDVKQMPDPMTCLQSGEADVAFVPYSSLHGSRGVELDAICSDGRKPFSGARNCFLTKIPPRMAMSSPKLSKVELDDVRFSLLSAADLFSSHPEIFRMFGSYNGVPNVIFSDHATGLKAVVDVVPSFEEYKKYATEIENCKV